MADSGSVIPTKNPEKPKTVNPSITRTTSETLRLTDCDRSGVQTVSTAPRKKTSFQITSVIVGSRASNDGGEDSADDLDESHTEDISEIIDNSRVTDVDNETPSYSEDTFSKDDVFFNASSSLVSAPVIPTSSQYGLALVSNSENSELTLTPSEISGDNCESSDIGVAVSESVINLGVVSTKHDPEMRDMHPPAPRTERFKVVKIESTEPFKRGRWVCMDYLDHNIAQNPTNKSDSDSSQQTSTVVEVHIPESSVSEDQLLPPVQHTNEVTNSIPPVNMQQASTDSQLVNNQAQQQPTMPISTPSTLPTGYTSVSPGQSLQTNLQIQSNPVNSVPSHQPSQQQQQQQSQSLSQVHMQQILSNSNQHQSLQPQQIQQVLANANVLQQAPQQQGPQQQQQPQQPQQPPQQTMQQQTQSMQAQQTMQPQQIIQQPMQQLPTMQQQYQPQQQAFNQFQPQMQAQVQQVHMQQNVQPNMQQNVQPNMQQMSMQQQQNQAVQQPQIMQQQMPQMPPQQSVHQQQVSYSQAMQPPATVVTQSQGMMQQMHPQMQQGFPTNQMMAPMQSQPIMNIQSQPHIQPQYYSNPGLPQSTPLINSQNGMMTSMSQAGNLPPLQTFASMPQPQQQQMTGGMPQNMPQTPPVQTSMPQYSMQLPPGPNILSSLPTMSMPQQMPSYSSVQQTYPQPTTSLPSTSLEIAAIVNAEHHGHEHGAHSFNTAPTAALLESLAEVTAHPEDAPAGEGDPESASGAGAVAIDNKIEQAMDLVKSHLMFAVREEVEVLKEKIAELMERISQLESENNILRAGASPETLAQLPPPQPSQSVNPS